MFFKFYDIYKVCFFHKNIKVHQARYSVLLMALKLVFFPPCSVLVVLLLVEHYWKCMLKELFIRHSFPNVPSAVWLSWKVDDDVSSILSGMVV